MAGLPQSESWEGAPANSSKAKASTGGPRRTVRTAQQETGQCKAKVRRLFTVAKVGPALVGGGSGPVVRVGS